MSNAIPMMAIVDERTLAALKDLVSSLVFVSFPPILVPAPIIVPPPMGQAFTASSRAFRARPTPSPTPAPTPGPTPANLSLASFDADPSALLNFLDTRLKTLDAKDEPPSFLHVGYNAEIATSSPPPGTPVPATNRNTSWMIPFATGDREDLRSALGLPPVAATSAASDRPVFVAVIDAGVDKEQFNVVGGWSPPSDASSEGSGGQWGSSDPHGDMVAYDVAAVAPFAKIYDIAALRPPGNRTPRLFDAAKALKFLSALTSSLPTDARLVICCSWMVLSEPPDLTASTALERFSYFKNPEHPFTFAVNQLITTGDPKRRVPIVFAAGNCGPDGYPPGCNTTDWPIGPGTSIRGANGLESVICVGAADLDGRLLSNSPRGPSTLGAAKPDLCGYAAFAGNNSTGDHGTSAACGVVAGVVAYLRHECPDASPTEIRDALRAGALKPQFDPGDVAYWGAGLVHATGARDILCSGKPSAPGTGLVQIVDGVVGRSPLSCQRRIRAICENRDKIFRLAALGDDERRAIEGLDGATVTALLKTQLEFALDQAWQGRTSLPERVPDDEDETIASCGDDRPRLLVNLIADLARSPDTRSAFFADQSGFVRTRYALSPDSCALAGSMTRGSCAGDSESAVDEAHMELEIHPQYPNVQSFPGPWIEAFFPDRGRLGDLVAVTVEGRGFVPGRPMMVALFERRIGPEEKPKYVCPAVATVSMALDASTADPHGQVLREKRKRDLEQLCEGVEAAKDDEPRVCDPHHGDLWFGKSVCKTWPPELAIPELRLGTLQLAEDLDLDSAATRFRLEVVFDLRNDQLIAGEYDLWVGHCNATGCQGRAAVGPTTFSVENPA